MRGQQVVHKKALASRARALYQAGQHAEVRLREARGLACGVTASVIVSAATSIPLRTTLTTLHSLTQRSTVLF